MATNCNSSTPLVSTCLCFLMRNAGRSAGYAVSSVSFIVNSTLRIAGNGKNGKKVNSNALTAELLEAEEDKAALEEIASMTGIDMDPEPEDTGEEAMADETLQKDTIVDSELDEIAALIDDSHESVPEETPAPDSGKKKGKANSRKGKGKE